MASTSAFWDALVLQQVRWEDEMIQDSALRHPNVIQITRFHCGGRTFAGARYRGEHGNLQFAGRNFAETAARPPA